MVAMYPAHLQLQMQIIMEVTVNGEYSLNSEAKRGVHDRFRAE